MRYGEHDELGDGRGDFLWQTLGADAGHADEPQGASARQHRSRGAGATKQMSEAVPELVLVNAGLIFALVSALACRVTPFSRITAPPRRRLQFVQALPLLGGDQDRRAAARSYQSYRSATSLHFVDNRVQILGVADRLLLHALSMYDMPCGKKQQRPAVPGHLFCDVRRPAGDGRHLAMHLAERHQVAVARPRCTG